MSSVFTLDDDPIVLVVPSSADIPPGNITEAEWLAIKDRVTVVEASGLGDLADVDTAGETGTALLKQADGSFAFGTVSGAIDRIGNAGTSENAYGVNWISLRRGIAFVESSPGTVLLDVVYGGTGTSNSVARSDHTHPIRPDDRFPFSASGPISGGTRTLVSDTVSGLDASRSYVVKATLYMHMRGDGTGASYVLPSVRLWTTTQNHFDDSRGVAGVLITETVQHPGVVVSGVSGVAVSASVAYRSGDPAYIGAGVLVVSVESNR